MGIADSPLRDRVIFVQGAPRSGTTWLVMLLATHPQIAGVEAESHLFDWGLDRLFDNFEGRHRRALGAYLKRPELVDVARDACDAVFLAMRSHLNGDMTPEFVVEKTPTSRPQGSVDLRRKRECYPDAWYLHIVRDGEAVARSLMRAPWMADRSAANCSALWRECVDWTRECLGDHPRYREVSYEELRSDSTHVCGELFRWLGVEVNEEILETARNMSQERFSEHGVLPPAPGSHTGVARRARRVARQARRAFTARMQRLLPDEGSPADEWSPLAFNFVHALRDRDEEALRSMTAGSLQLVYRSADGDLRLQGDAARDAMLRMASGLFTRIYASERWAAAQGGPREWWTPAPGQPFWTVFLSAVGGDATRIDLAFGLTPKDQLIADVVVISAGSLGGRPVRELTSSSDPILAASFGERQRQQ